MQLNFGKNNKIKENNEIIFEEIEQKFFYKYSWHIKNYQVIPCFKLIIDKNNYINNFGFYVSTFLLFLIIINMLIYIIIGEKKIRNKYYIKRLNFNTLKEVIRISKKK